MLVDEAVLLGDLPGKTLILLGPFESLLELGTWRVQPELHDERPIVRQRPLEALDMADTPLEFLFIDTTQHTLENRPRRPLPMKNPDPTSSRKTSPITPESRSLGLFLGEILVDVRFEQPRVHPLVEEIDDLGETRSVTTRQDDDRGKIRVTDLVLHGQESDAQDRLLLLVVALVERPPELCGFEHYSLLATEHHTSIGTVAPLPTKQIDSTIAPIFSSTKMSA